jgi:Gram-negative bacterial TonB protein C-terminal
MRRIVLLAVCVMPATAFAQVPQLISPDQARQRVVTPVVPQLAPLAAIAHMYGDLGEVKVQIVIDTQGRPTQLTVLSGWVGSHAVSIRSIRRSSYEPFVVDGKPVPVTTVVTLRYNDKTPPAPAQVTPEKQNEWRYLSVEQEACANALRNPSKPEKQLKPCTEAARLAEPLDLDEWSNRLEYIYLAASSAFQNNKQFDQALTFADKTLSRVAEGYGDASTPGSAYLARAEAEIGLKNMTAANADLTNAEASIRSAASWIQEDKLKQN